MPLGIYFCNKSTTWLDELSLANRSRSLVIPGVGELSALVSVLSKSHFLHKLGGDGLCAVASDFCLNLEKWKKERVTSCEALELHKPRLGQSVLVILTKY